MVEMVAGFEVVRLCGRGIHPTSIHLTRIHQAGVHQTGIHQTGIHQTVGGVEHPDRDHHG